ncbi:MAG TPA: NADH-quinone oxidoreductase subunit H [Ktedonobacterales bacterium]|nr:NADH-quinone oxidoreductase subunit H [Ktedonobacterales bacterium]
MSAIPGFIVAVLIYPGVIVALLAAWAFGWVRGALRGALSGGQAPTAMGEVNAWRGLFARESVIPEGVHPVAVALGTTLAVVFPLLALILLPVPGNPLATALGLTGDLAAEGALLLGLPLARVFVGWAIPSPYTRLAADRSARLLAGALPPFVLALTAAAQVLGQLTLTPLPTGVLPSFTLLTLALCIAAFACALPVLAHVTPLHADGADLDTPGDELSELSGRDLAFFRVGEALQLVACAALLVTAFVLPLVAGWLAGLTHVFSNVIKNGAVDAGLARVLVLLVGVALVAAGLGAWDGIYTRRPSSGERPPLSWWFGLPILLGMAALVAAAWATRGV